MKSTDTIIIGGGQAGLAMSRCLGGLGVDHVVLERGRVAERWRSERWDSLRLLTPNWQSRLPGWQYDGPDPDGYMTMPEIAAHLEGYARSFGAPIHCGTSVRSVARAGSGFRVETDHGTWTAPSVVIATGACGEAWVPPMASRLDPDVLQVVPARYRNPEQLPSGGVLVVGASASGVQIASELQSSGRAVTLAVGRHTRLPRVYRGHDILWHLDRIGTLDERAEEVRDLAASRREPSLQLVGRPDRRSLDLAVLQEQGVRLAGRLAAIDGARVDFADDLGRSVLAAEAKRRKVLGRIDAFLARDGVADEEPSEEASAVAVEGAPTRLNLRRSAIRTVLWATGYRPAYPWLHAPVLDGRGQIVHDRGITPVPGLYVLGLPFLRRRKSTFIDGVGDDARELAAEISAHLHRSRRAAA